MAEGFEVRDTVIGVLLNEPDIHPDHFPGGILPQVPKAGSGRSATPNAFYDETNPLLAGLLKNTISVLDGADVPAPDGAARHGFQGFPLVRAYILANDPESEEAVGVLEERLHLRFRRGISYPRDDGGGMEIIVLERTPLVDADDFGYPGNQFTEWRIQATYLRRV